VGQKVPDFTLADTNGNNVSLDLLLDKPNVPVVEPPDVGPATPTKAVLLVFYRGYW